MSKKITLVCIIVFCFLLSGIVFVKNKNSILYFSKSIKNQTKVVLLASSLVHDANKVKEPMDVASYDWNGITYFYAHSWNYCSGIMMRAFSLSGHNLFVNKFYNDNIFDNGKVNYTRNRHNFFIRGSVDEIVPARTVFYIPKYLYKEKYTRNAKRIYNELMNQPELPNLGDNYYHKINNRAWIDYPFCLDGLYMALPFLVEYDKFVLRHNRWKITSKIFKKLDWVSKNLKNEEGLYYHGCKADGKTVNGYVWLRGVGWYAMAQVDILKSFPEGKQKEILKKQLKEFFDAMIKYQDPQTGMWYNVIYPNDIKVGCNNLESSGTAMMAYALMSAYVNDFVTEKKYAYYGLKSFNGVINHSLKKREGKYYLADTYKAAIVFENPKGYTYCKDYVENDAKGLAPLIMASTYVPKTYKKLLINKIKTIFD